MCFMCPVSCLPYHLFFPCISHIVTLHQYMSVKFSLPNLSETRPRRKLSQTHGRLVNSLRDRVSHPPSRLEFWLTAQYGGRGGDVVGLCFQDGCEFTNATTLAMADRHIGHIVEPPLVSTTLQVATRWSSRCSRHSNDCLWYTRLCHANPHISCLE